MNVFGKLPKFLEHLLESDNFSTATTRTKTVLGFLKIRSLFRGIFFQGTWHILFQRGKGEKFPVVSEYFLVLFLAYADYHPVCQSFGAFLRHQASWHSKSHPKFPLWIWSFQVGFHRNLQPSNPSVSWHQRRHRMQWWYFPFRNERSVSRMVWEGLASKDLWNTLFISQGFRLQFWVKKPFWSLMEPPILDLLWRKRQMVCKNTLLTCQ